MNIVSLNDIRISFGKRTILSGVNFEFGSRLIVAITGQSGSGKTTLLGVISGLLKPDSGAAYYKSDDIYRWNDFKRSRYRNREIGYVYQSFNLIPDLTARQNIVFPIAINRRAEMIRDKIDYLVEYLDLRMIIDQYPDSLSGGEKQRVAIARAVINWPKVLLADEPTGNLDKENGKKIFSLFKILKEEKGITVIAATHDRHIIKNSDLHYHLDNGKLMLKKG